MLCQIHNIEVCKLLKFLHFSLVISLKTILYYANLSTNYSLDQQQELHQDPKYSYLSLRKSKYLVILLVLSIVRSRRCLESEFRTTWGCLDATVTMSVTVSVVSDRMLIQRFLSPTQNTELEIIFDYLFFQNSQGFKQRLYLNKKRLKLLQF